PLPQRPRDGHQDRRPGHVPALMIRRPGTFAGLSTRAQWIRVGSRHARAKRTRTKGAQVAESYVVTGGGRGVGRAIVERLLADSHTVVVLERDPDALAWTADHPASARLFTLVGDATDETVTGQA